MSVFRIRTDRVLLCWSLLVSGSARFTRESTPVCDGVIFFTLFEPHPLSNGAPRESSPVCHCHPQHPSALPLPISIAAFVCVGSMGIDILFPIVRVLFFVLATLRVFFNYNSFSYPINHQYFHCPSAFSFGVGASSREYERFKRDFGTGVGEQHRGSSLCHPLHFYDQRCSQFVNAIGRKFIFFLASNNFIFYDSLTEFCTSFL